MIQGTEHGARFAKVITGGRLEQIGDSYTLLIRDPERLARLLRNFIVRGRPSPSAGACVVIAVAGATEAVGQHVVQALRSRHARWCLYPALMGPVRFCHATTRSDTEIVLVGSPVEHYRDAFADTDEPTVVLGHTQMPFDRLADRCRLSIPGV